MSKRQETIVFNLQANVEQIKQSANEINNVFSKLNLPQNVQASFSKTFNKLTEDIRTFEAQAGKGFKNLADTKKAEKNIETIVTDFEKLRVQIKDVKGFPADKLLPKEVLNRIKQYKDLLEKANKLTLKDNSSSINKAAEAVKRAQQKFDDNEQSIKKNNTAIEDNEDRYKELSQYISDAEKSLKALVARREELKNKKNRTNDEASEYEILDTRIKAVKSSLTSYNKELISNEANGKKLEETQSQLSLSAVTLQENLNKANQELTNIKNSSAVTDSELQNLKQSLANIANVDPGTLPETLQGLITKIQALSADASNIDAIKNALGELESKLHSAADSAQQTGQTFHNTTTQSVEDMIRANSEMEQLKTRLTYFFSAMNGVQLFKRAIRSAYESVKELDAAITEMAVVTNYSINDIWGNIPEYTRTATELGATTKDVINSMVLYTQQGLNMSQATELSTQTMKMARIAGLEGAEATDLMTAALRGFNMELNETSAQRVNDVYSNLAANAAANTHEIADAMTRTASIANAAGMEFETTAAFLTQMIETTRESAENLGTAMKTIIARFTEMKKAPGDIVEVDGEEVDVNKVETALKSAGIQARDTAGEFRDVDDVLLELSSKWDSLDKMSQRYIATTAAGSRQQSRFIAMMSNYQRTMELMGYATNSAGASQEQFEKTMDSLESKLNRLHDAWEQYVTGIANQSIIKGVVDLLTGLLETVNKVTDALDPFHTGWSKILAAFLGFKAAKGVVNGVLKGIGTQLGTRNKTGLDEKQGTVDGTKYGKGFWGAFQKMQAQKQPDAMPLNEKTKATKEAMKAQGMSTKKFTLTGKDTQAAKVFRDQSKALKEQSDAAGRLSTKYKDYSDSIQKASTASKNGKVAIDNNRKSLLSLNTQLQEEEKAYRDTLQAGTAEYESSVARSEALGREVQSIQDAQNIQELKNVSTNAGTTANNLNTASEELNEKAKQANTTATVLEGEALDVENIKQQASNMTKGQALLALFSLNREKRLAAAVALGLASAEEVQAMATKGATGAQTAFNAALYSCPIMWIIAAIAALVAGLILLTSWLNKIEEDKQKSLEAKMEGASKAAEDAAEKAVEAKEAFDNLLESKNTYNKLSEELRSLVKGSDEYIQKLQEIKDLVNTTVEENPEIAPYVTYDEDGKPSISPEGYALAEKNKKEQIYLTELMSGVSKIRTTYDDYLKYIENAGYELSGHDVKFAKPKDEDEMIENGDFQRGNDSTHNASDTFRIGTDQYTGPANDSTGLSAEFFKQVARYKISGDISTTETDKTPYKVGNYYVSEEAYNDLGFVAGEITSEDWEEKGGKSTYKKNIGAWHNSKYAHNQGMEAYGAYLTDDTLGKAIDRVFSDKTADQQMQNMINTTKFNYQAVLMNQLSNLPGVGTPQAYAFSKFYSERMINDGTIVDLIEQYNTSFKKYSEQGLNELETAYTKQFGAFNDELAGLDPEDEQYEDKKKGYMASLMASTEAFKNSIDADIATYSKLMTEHGASFADVLNVAAKNIDKNISGTLLNSLLKYSNAAEFLANKENDLVRQMMNIDQDEFDKMWAEARAEAQQKIGLGVELFDKNKVNKVDNKYSSINVNYEQILEERIGKEQLFKLGDLASSWKQQIEQLNTKIYGADNKYLTFDTSNILSGLLNTDLFKDAEAAEETYQKLSKIDFSNPIHAAKTIDEYAKNSSESTALLGETLKRNTVDVTSLTRQVQYAWKTIDSDTMSDLFEDGAATTEEIRELTKTLPDLADLLDLNSISASTLAKYFNEVHSGMLDIETTSANFIQALDKINEAQNLITDSMDYINNFEASTSQQTITDSLSEWRDSMEQSLERGQYGDQNLQDYAKAILGIDNWNKYYAEFNGNLQKVEELAFSKISLWKDNFYDLWKDFAGKSSLVSLGSSDEIIFDLTNISSIDELRQQLMDTYDFSEEMADAAIADAQTYSSELNAALKQLSIGDSIQSLLENAVQNNITKTVNISKAELEILASEAGMEFNDLVDSINNTLDKTSEGWHLDYSEFLDENGQLTEDKVKEYMQRVKSELVDPNTKVTKKMSGVNEQVTSFSLDKMYSEMLSKGMKPDQIKTQIQSILKDATKDMATGNNKVFYYFKDGILNAYTGALTDKKKIAESLGVSADLIYDSIDSATAGGMLDGLQDEKVRAQKDLDALDTLESTAKAVFLGYKLGMMESEDINSKVSNDLYNKIEGALTSALKGKRDELNDILNSSSKLETGTFSSNYNSNNLGQYTSYTTQTSQNGWNNDDDDDDDDSDSDSDSDWTNDYDKYYNTLKKIEGLERKSTELEKQQSRLTKQRYLDEEKIKANKKAQVDLLKQQARINSDLADTAAAYLRGDSNGDVWFDEATGTIQTNPNAANYNEEQMEAFNDQKSLMEDHYETWKEAKDNLEDIYDAIDELTEVAEFSLEDLTDSVDRAIEVLDNTLTNLDREISRLDRYDSGVTSSDYKKRYEQSAQTYADKYNQLTTKKAINEQKLNGQMYSEYGKYINVDWNTKEVTKSALYYAITDPDIKDKVDDFVDNTQEIASNIIDMDNQQEEIRDSLYELQQTLADKSLEFQEKVYDAVVKSREDTITTLNNIDTSIKDAASNLISSIQKNLQKIRQDRQNQDKEEELQDMEARLAYYQVDTSNANQKNILDLQKQLEDKQRSYTDTLIDQKISELQQQNDEAAEQRKKQIDIMETQLSLDKENGVIWKAVDNAIRTGFNSSGRIQKGSDLYNMLSSLDEVTKKNSIQFEHWFGELNNLAVAYNANLTANLNTSGQMSNTVSNANDVYGENSEYIKSLKDRLEAMNRDGNFNHLMWYDQEGQKMVYKYSYYEASSKAEADAYNKKVAEYQALANELANARAFYQKNKNALFLSSFDRMYGYATGGLADFTGPAWLDGTKSSPELILNARDTENFIQLKDVLSDIMTHKPNKSETNGDFYFDIHIDVDKITNDYDVDKIASRIKQQITNEARYRNVNIINMRR